MSAVSKIILLLVAIAAIAGVVYLATREMPAGVTPVERTIPDERFAH